MTSKEFDTLYRKNYPVLYRLAYSLLRDEEDCRDLVNDVFAEVLDNDSLEGVQNYDGYLFRSVRNRALNIIERKKTIEKVRNLYPIEQDINSVYDVAYDKKLLQVNELMDSELSANARNVMRLVFEKGNSYKDAAEQLGVSVAAINKHVVKSLRLLREKINVKTNQ